MIRRLAIEGGTPAVAEGPPPWPPADAEVLETLQQAFADGSWGKYDGPNSEQLTSMLSQMHAGSHVLLCSSGTIAVELALRGLQVTGGDEVILAGYDFSGNFRSVEAVGATPVLVDIDPRTWCLSADQLELAVSTRTKAAIVSHLHGGTAKMRQICEVATRRGFAVIEDACQMPGALIDGKVAGTWGDMGILSFGGSKLLTSGRGGAVITRHDYARQRIKVFGERGNSAFPLSELQAAVLIPQLRRLKERNRTRHNNVAYLRRLLDDLTCLKPVAATSDSDRPAFYKLALLLDTPPDTTCTRQQFISAVRAEGIALDAGFRGFTRRSPRRCRKPGSLAASQRAADQTMLLHHPVLLQSGQLMQTVAEGIRKVAQARLLATARSQ